MKETRLLMGMPITVEIVDVRPAVELTKAIAKVYAYFDSIDQRFSTYKDTSEISRINKGLIKEKNYSEEMKTVLALCEQTKKETNGYFDIALGPSGSTPAVDSSSNSLNGLGTQYDPSGLVKGWAIQEAARQLKNADFRNFYIDAGGDIQVSGKNAKGTT